MKGQTPRKPGERGFGEKKKKSELIDSIKIKERIRYLKAQQDLLHFTKYIMGEDYEIGWHHRLLASKLTDFAMGKIDKLVINIMPQAGKSQLSCRLLPAFLLGLNPKENIAICSYAADLANSFNRDCQHIMETPEYKQLFPNTKLPILGNSDTLKRTQNEVRIAQGGMLISQGIGGPLTGKNLTVGIIDDCIKNSEESLSPAINNRNLQWYTTTFASRFRKKQRVLMLFTRWSEMDLAARIPFEQELGKWEVIKIPALSTQKYLDDPNKPKEDPRTEVGQAMYPPWHDKQLLNDIRETAGSRVFECLYQQDPSPEDGLILKRNYFGVIQWGKFFPGMIWDFFLDTAYTEKSFNDPSALMCAGYDKGRNQVVIRKVSTVRMELPELVAHIQEFVGENGYTNSSRIYIENQASGKSVAQSLKKESNLNVVQFKFPKIDGIRLTDKDKVMKASAISGQCEAGRVKLIEGSWIDPFLHECAAFPGSKHDDMVDCLIMAVLQFLYKKKQKGIKIR